MSNERKLRLLQVAKEFKVGIATITDFLEKKSIHIESSPNTPVEPDVYAVLEKEFGGNRSANDRVNVRERINLKPESVSLHDKKDSPRAQDGEFEKEVVIKSGVISAREEIRTGPKIVGKIDLSGGSRKPAAPQPAAAPKEEPETPPAAPSKQEEVRPAPTPQPEPAAPVAKPKEPVAPEHARPRNRSENRRKHLLPPKRSPSRQRPLPNRRSSFRRRPTTSAWPKTATTSSVRATKPN